MENATHTNSDKSNYTKFMLMLLSLFVAMYITMYLNTYAIDHVYFSLTRFYMTCMGISTMAVIMWFFMRKMYKKQKEKYRNSRWELSLIFQCIRLGKNPKPNHW
jgi:undecaprenyl pyrophosphate phosphatase UppP